MAVYKVQGPDGKTYRVEGPDGASSEEVIAQAQKLFNPDSAFGDKVSDQSLSDLITGKPEPTNDSRMTGFIGGLTKPIDKLAELAMNIPGARQVDEFLANLTGTPTVAEDNAAKDAMRADNSRTGYQTLGNVVGTIPTMMAGGGPIRQGAIGGALLSDQKDAGGILTDAGIGALASKAGDAIIGGAANLAKPYVSKGAELLRDAGVPMTLGQLAEQAGSGGGAISRYAGKAVKGLEDRLGGLPIVGDIINPARQRSVEAYNRAVLNRALKPIGKALPAEIETGHEAVKFTGDALSAGYDALLPKLSAKVDRGFVDGLQGVWDEIGTLPNDRQEQFKNIMDSVFVNRADKGTFSGEMLKEAESKLEKLVRGYSKSPDPDQRGLGYALDDVLGEFRDLIARNNPKAAPVLSALNKGWSELTIAEKAAARQGNTTGVFSPKQYAAESRLADTTVRRRATARGTRPNQETTDAAASILPNNVPDSGSAGRIVAAGLGAGVAGIEPTTAAMVGLGSLPYTQMGQRLLNQLMVGERGPKAAATANFLQELRKLAPAVMAPLTQQE